MPDPRLAETVVARLAAWRVPRVFGVAGEAVAALVEALHAAGGDPEFVPVRHGESAASMAIGHARLTGGLGVCLSPAGPAAFGLLGGLDAARRAALPVLAIIGDEPTDDPTRVDRMFAGLGRRLWHVGDLYRGVSLVDEAVRSALAGHGPACLVLPGNPSDPQRVEARASTVRSGAETFPDPLVLDDPGRPSAGAGAAGLVFDELSVRVPPRAAVTVDSEPVLSRYAGRLSPGTAVLACDAHEGPGAALPSAVAAKLADPERPVLALVTDDGMRSHGLAELVTIARRWPQWPDPRLVVLVLNTRAGYPGRQVADDVPYAGWARLLGLHGVRVDRPEWAHAAWDKALTADRPCLLDLIP
ncbi:thiamine pyrophosphate-binding protein [Micromonospora sp. NPDC051196]|uniref:thiamine pyrophosphate-binding protein n=1 Tax=Micromonospora sp. NPDC051196 TaxID=3155281 RepID=UPI003442799E